MSCSGIFRCKYYKIENCYRKGIKLLHKIILKILNKRINFYFMICFFFFFFCIAITCQENICIFYSFYSTNQNKGKFEPIIMLGIKYISVFCLLSSDIYYI